MNKVAIDLTWVRHNKVGGTESCVRNLLDGFSMLDCADYKLILLLSNDNKDSFEQYRMYPCFELYECQVNSTSQKERVLWQNLHLCKVLEKLGIRICLEPVYGKPYLGSKNIKFITTIHDLQAKHYPHYFSKGRVVWMKLSWKNAVHTSAKVVAISNYVKDDIIKTFKVSEDKIQVIYDAVSVDTEQYLSEDNLARYRLSKGGYYYTVSSLFLHKNLKTAVLTIAELKRRNSPAFRPLVISGIGGRKRDELDAMIESYGLQDDIIFTSYVDDRERNMLYKNCRAFVFTSIFEGFGMPPIEAMAFGVPVLSTDKTSLREVTAGLCNYVEDPFNPVEWANQLESDLKLPRPEDVETLLKTYDKRRIAQEYLRLFDELLAEQKIILL